MIERLTAKPGVIALRVDGHLGRADLETCFDLLAESFANRAKTSLYIEIAGLTGLDTEVLIDDFRRGFGLLDRLDRFDRVAIVSDDAWIRWVSRIESALLPGITYRTYRFSEQQQALDWVQGRSDLPYGHALAMIPTTRADVIGIEVDGRLTGEEVVRFARDVNRMRHERPLKAVLVRFRSLAGFDPAIAMDREYLSMKLRLLEELDRYALVGGPDWLVTWAELLRPLLRLDLRHFAADDEAAAWAWLGAQPLSEHRADAEPAL